VQNPEDSHLRFEVFSPGHQQEVKNLKELKFTVLQK
jgi:hypothetical protein